MSGVTLVDAALLEALSDEARASARRRKNRNIHASESEPCNRLLNAVEPDSYIAPHRHLDPNKDETFVVLRGSFGVVIFDDAGAVSGTHLLAAGGERVGIDIAHGTWHSLVALESGSVFLEAKGGPYAALAQEERAGWAPREGEAPAARYLEGLRRLFAAA